MLLCWSQGLQHKACRGNPESLMCGRMRGEGETRREALLKELHDLEARLTPMRCAHISSGYIVKI